MKQSIISLKYGEGSFLYGPALCTTWLAGQLKLLNCQQADRCDRRVSCSPASQVSPDLTFVLDRQLRRKLSGGQRHIAELQLLQMPARYPPLRQLFPSVDNAAMISPACWFLCWSNMVTRAHHWCNHSKLDSQASWTRHEQPPPPWDGNVGLELARSTACGSHARTHRGSLCPGPAIRVPSVPRSGGRFLHCHCILGADGSRHFAEVCEGPFSDLHRHRHWLVRRARSGPHDDVQGHGPASGERRQHRHATLDRRALSASHRHAQRASVPAPEPERAHRVPSCRLRLAGERSPGFDCDQLLSSRLHRRPGPHAIQDLFGVRDYSDAVCDPGPDVAQQGSAGAAGAGRHLCLAGRDDRGRVCIHALCERVRHCQPDRPSFQDHRVLVHLRRHGQVDTG